MRPSCNGRASLRSNSLLVSGVPRSDSICYAISSFMHDRLFKDGPDALRKMSASDETKSKALRDLYPGAIGGELTETLRCTPDGLF
jgi:hypothetical protein